MGCCGSNFATHLDTNSGVNEFTEITDAGVKEFTDMSSLVDICRSGAVRLVKAEYIVNQYRNTTEPMPCRQDLPDEAFLHIEDLMDKDLADLKIFVLSYCWVTADHPDPGRYHLETVARLLEIYLECPPDGGKDGLYAAYLQAQGFELGGQGRPVAVFWDWSALPQDKPQGRRTEAETALFSRGLECVNTWYAHEATTVVALTTLPGEASRPAYADSGWTTFEKAVAEILTPGPRFLLMDEDARARVLDERTSKQPGDFHDLAEEFCDGARSAPCDSESFNELIRGKKVTNGADIEKVLVPRYEETFNKVIKDAGTLSLCHCGITNEGARLTLRLAQAHCKRLRCLRLSNNDGVDLGLAEVAAACIGLERLDLSGCRAIGGELPDLAGMTALTELKLNHTEVAGDLAGLASLTTLTDLNLANTRVAGDVAGLASLTTLTDLYIGHTQVAGDVAGLASLTELTILYIGHTQVAGDVAGLASLTKLTVLCLHDTRVTGDVAGLASLTKLTYLKLSGTPVTGDVAGLASLTKLTVLYIGHTQVAGDVAGLASLTELTDLYLEQMQVEGDVAGLASLTKLTELNLSGTQVTGDVARLASLTELTELRLNDTRVEGDVAGLASLTELTYLNLSRTQVTGDVAGLASLTKLAKLDLDGTQVVGDLASLRR